MAGFSSMRITSLPWLTAAGAKRTASLMTTVPVRELTITRAATGAGETASISISAMMPDLMSLPCGKASSMLTPSAMVAIPALVACAAALHDDVRIQPKRHETGWTESARLWCAIVGNPSVKKSPAIRRATRRLRKIDADLGEQNARLQADYADQLEQHKEAKKEARKTGATCPAPERPALQRMIVEDVFVNPGEDPVPEDVKASAVADEEKAIARLSRRV